MRQGRPDEKFVLPLRGLGPRTHRPHSLADFWWLGFMAIEAMLAVMASVAFHDTGACSVPLRLAASTSGLRPS